MQDPLGVEAGVGSRLQVTEAARPMGAETNATTAGEVNRAPSVAPDALRDYRLALARAAKPFRRYPALARERGWEGIVRVELSWRAGVPGALVSMAESCGHGMLDEQAVEMLRRAAAQTPLPASLQGHSFSMVLPVEFSLNQP